MSICKNGIINDIGLFVIPHYNTSSIELFFTTEDGAKCQVSIKQEKLNNFLKLFVHDSDFDEDGFYLHALKGKYIRIVFNDSDYVEKIGHIILDKWFYL